MSQDRREKIQDMLLERVEHLITQYDEERKHDTTMDNADTLASIAKVLQTRRDPTLVTEHAPRQAQTKESE